MRGFQLIKWQVNYHYLYHNKKKNHKRYHAVGIVPIEKWYKDAKSTQIHARLLQGFQYKVVVLMTLFYGNTPSPLSNMMWSGKCFPHGSNMPTLTYDRSKQL